MYKILQFRVLKMVFLRSKKLVLQKESSSLVLEIEIGLKYLVFLMVKRKYLASLQLRGLQVVG